MGWIDYGDPQLLPDVAARLKRSKTQNPNDAIVAKRIADIYRVHPYMPTGVVLSLAEAGADMATVNEAAKKSSLNQYVKSATTALTPEQKKQAEMEAVLNKKNPINKALNWMVGGVAKGLGKVFGNIPIVSEDVKDNIKFVSALAETVPAFVDSLGSALSDPKNQDKYGGGSQYGLLPKIAPIDFDTLPITQYFKNFGNTGEGFTLGGVAEEKRLEAVKKFRWDINGENYTIGRGTANMVFAPGSKPYRFLSGTVDAGKTWYLDVTNKPIEAISAIQKAKKVIPFLETADEIAAASKLAKGSAGLLSTAEQHAIDNSKFFNWLDNSRWGQTVVKRSVEETDEFKIFEAYGGKITPAEARRIANAKTTDEVRGIIAEQAVRLSDETVQGMVPFATSADQLPITQRIPVYKWRNSSRWLSKVPKNTLLVNGTDDEKAAAVQNIGNWMKLMKVDPYSGPGKVLMTRAFDAYGAEGTRVESDQLFRLFMGDERTATDGILHLALDNGGVDRAITDDIAKRFRTGLDAFRKNAIDAAGRTDDNGFIVHMTGFMDDTELYDLLKDVIPYKITPGMTRTQLDDVVKNLEPGEITTWGPLAVSDMLNNVQILPDPRQIRRLTTNPFFRVKADGQELMATSIVSYIQNDLWRPYALMSFGYIMRNTMDANLRMALHGISTDRPIDYIMMLLGKRGVGTVSQGRLWKEAGEETLMGEDDLLPFTQFVKSRAAYLVDDPAEALTRLVQNGEATVANTADTNYLGAFIDSARQIYVDPLLRLYSRIMHLPDPRQKQILIDAISNGTNEAKNLRKTIVDYLVDGPLVVNKNNGRTMMGRGAVSNAKSMTDDELITAWVDTAGKFQVDQFTVDGLDELRTVVGYNHVPLGPSEMWDEATIRRLNGGARPKVGEVISYDVGGAFPKFENWLVLETNYGSVGRATPGTSTTGTSISQVAVWTPETKIDLQDGFTTADEFATFSDSEKALSKAFVESVDDTEFVYHATPAQNIASIGDQGLTPQSTIDEFGITQDPATYVSDNLPNMLQNAPSPSSQAERLGSGELAVLRFKLPKNASIDYGTRIGEGVLTDVIDPKNIEVLTSDGTWVSMTKLISPPGSVTFTGTGPRSFKVIQVDDLDSALIGEQGSDLAQKFIKDRLATHAASKGTGGAPLVPEWVRGQIRVKPVTDQGTTEGGRAFLKAAATPAQWFFSHIVQPFGEMAERSPAFRISYYRNIAENAMLLTPVEAQKLIDNIDTYAKRTFPKLYTSDPTKAIEKYIGGKNIWNDIKTSTTEAASRATGVGTVEQLETYSGARAKVDMEELFFSNVEKSNLADAMRIIAPFGAAWAEVAGRYTRELIQDPSRMRKTQLLYRGAEGFDPDQDGRGLIYHDAQTGEMMFTFPLSGRIAKFLTGVPGVELAAPVKRLSAGIAVVPGVGPMVQIAAGKIFDQLGVPDTNQLRKVVNPYGNTKFANLVPGSFSKAYSAIFDSPDTLNTVYGSTYIDVFSFMSTSGEYDLSDSNDVERLVEDAKTKSRGIALLRALSQFVGPTAAKPEYRFKSELSDYYYVNEMLKQYSEWQEENYETATEKFINTFGDEAMIYLAGKTKTNPQYQGLEASAEFGTWADDNKGLVAAFKSTAPYLAPVGARDLSMQVWSKQIATGKRYRVDAVDRLAEAQKRLGSAIYFSERRKYGDTLNKASRDELKAVRVRLHEKYPGFPVKASFDPGEFDTFIGNLERLIKDKRTEGNPVARDIKLYLNARTQSQNAALSEAGVSLQAEKNPRANELRGSLFGYGEQLADNNPDFRRIWEEKLSPEVEE